MYDTSHILEHHGVKGQKWGVRRNTHSVSSHTSKRAQKKAARHAVHEEKKASRKREKSWQSTYNNRSKMTDQELRSALTRIQLENQLRSEVAKAGTSQYKYGKQIAQNSANQAVSAATSAAIKKALKAAAAA